MEKSQINLKLGDIINVTSTTNLELNDRTYYIEYIDNAKIRIKNVLDFKITTLNLQEVTGIQLLDRDKNEGYARQNGLSVHTWVDITIGTNVVTGEITNLENDMIEVTTFPERRVMYLDFAYKGPLNNIDLEIRDKPVIEKEKEKEEEVKEGKEEGEKEEEKEEEDYHDILNELYIDADTVIFGDEIEDLYQVVEVPESERRYGVELQVNDMMDSLLSTIPNRMRTKKVMDNINTLIKRFKQLRRDFSTFDDNHNITGFSHDILEYKSLVYKMRDLKETLKWIIPVVSQKRRIYTSIEQDDIIASDFKDELKKQVELYKKYKDSNLAYGKLYEKQPLPFIAEADGIITTKQEIFTDLEAIVDNLGAFFSTVGKNGLFQYAIQRYNTGLTKKDNQLQQSGKNIFIRNNMTPNDKITINSVLMLPKSVARFSKISRPGTDIATRSDLHHNYFSLFRLFNEKNKNKNDTTINTHIIDDFTREIDNDLTNIKHFNLDDTLVHEPDKMAKFLNTILPSTDSLVKLMGNRKMSLLNLVKELEPFGVYLDDISLKQYNTIKIYINDQIKEFNKQYSEKSSKFNEILDLKFNSNDLLMNKILFIVNNTNNYDEKPELLKLFNDGYAIDSTKYRSGELLSNIISKDGGQLLSQIIVALSLKTQTDILSMFEPANIDDITDTEKIKPKDCFRRYLTKRYSNIKELQMDNGKKEVFYDKEFDDTPYHILSQYANQKKSMEPKAFIEFVAENLIQKHGVAKEISSELASTLISGKKLVSDGEYAIVQPDGYFHRVKDHWVRDTSMASDLLIDTNTLFCNLQSDCFKNDKNMVCEPNQAKMNALAKSRLVGEFERRVETSFEQMDKKIKQVLTEDFRRIKRDIMISTIKTNRPNNFAYALGKTAVVDEILISPNAPLLDIILAQDDFTKRHRDTIAFANKFCRESLVDLHESQFWLYCKATNTKLLPTCFKELAETSSDDYQTKLAEICRKRGVTSDDGDSIVDKHSGRILRKIDLVEEEIYNEQGFRVQTHDIIEKDFETRIGLILAPKQRPVFENKQNEIIYNILDSICEHIGIDIKMIQDFVMRTTTELLSKENNSDKQFQYAKIVKARLEKTGKTTIPFEIHCDRLMFWYLASTLLVSIQTAVPSFHVKKTFPGCYRSFTGYPMTGIEDKNGIKYLACVLHKMKSSTEPWNSIEKLNTDVYVSKISETIETIILRPDIKSLYDNKRELREVEIVPEEHNVAKWLTFLPPVVPYEMGTIQTVPREFENDLLELIRKGHKDQREQLDIIKGKCVQYGYGVIELINKIVKTKDQILKTGKQDPYLENACCNDSLIHEPVTYFANIDNTIGLYDGISKSLSEFVNESKKYAKPSTLYHSESTSVNYTVEASKSHTDNIYAAYISYCNFENDQPIPSEYKSVCPEKPVGFPIGASLIEQIEFLNKNGRKYSVVEFNNLMTIVRIKNKLNIPKSAAINQTDVILGILDEFEEKDSQVIEPKMIEHLRAVMSSYDPSIMVVEPRESLVTFKDYLINANGEMFSKISAFMDVYGNQSYAEYEKLQKFLKAGGTPEFIRNSIYFMTRAIPSMILNGTSFNHLPESWKFANPHYSDLGKMVEKTWDNIKGYSGDIIISGALKDIELRSSDIFLLISELPIYKPIVKGEHTYYSLFDSDSVKLMYEYLWFSAIYEYIVSASNPDLLYIDIESKKTIQRERIIEPDLAMGLDVYGDEDDDMREVDIKAGNEDEYKKRIAKLILSIFKIDIDNQQLTMSYDEISKKIRKSKTNEKQKMVEYLGKMADDERANEQQFKKYKMGKWNIGKELFKYDKKNYSNNENGDEEEEDEDGYGDGEEEDEDEEEEDEDGEENYEENDD
jgi:hypothetical protein